jgi:hypothetical protein
MEPFGYFKCGAFDWTDCAATDEGAIPLYEWDTVAKLVHQRDELLKAVEDFRKAKARSNMEQAFHDLMKVYVSVKGSTT